MENVSDHSNDAGQVVEPLGFKWFDQVLCCSEEAI